MKLRNLCRALHPTHPHHRSVRYPDLTAECRDELTLIAERRRSDITGI